MSFEIFYAGRSHESVRAGAELLAVPTNTSSYSTSQVPAQEIAAAIVQAVETGRDLVQAAPTGFSAVVTQRGVVVQRSALGRRQVLFATVALRRGLTPYDHWGDLPRAGARRAGARRRVGPPAALLVVAGVDVDAGHAGRHVHGVVGRIVLEGEPQVEPVGAEVLHHRLLELGDLGVVPARAHDQQVPAQPVALQPGQRLGLDAVGPAGEEDDGERGVEQLQQPGDLLDHGVVAAGLEEGRPVPPPPFEEVLAAGGVGQDAVDVEDDGRPAGCGAPPSACQVQLIRSSSGLVSGTKDEPNGVCRTPGGANPPNCGGVGGLEGDTMDGEWDPTLTRGWGATPATAAGTDRTLAVALGRRVEVIGDLLLPPEPTDSSRAACRDIAQRLAEWQGPGIVIVCGRLVAPGCPDDPAGVAGHAPRSRRRDWRLRRPRRLPGGRGDGALRAATRRWCRRWSGAA